jgi:pimeloyl-[acyl-carrier protein] methyl ester esterase
VHIEQRGSGPALIMLHGWAMHSDIFAPLIAELEHHFCLYLVDLPGHGRSRDDQASLDLDLIVDAIRRQVPQNAAWCGWSLGGLIALRAAQRQNANALIMLCASPRFVNAAHWPQGMNSQVFEQFAHDLETDYRGTLDRFLMLEAQGSEHQRQALRMLRDAVFTYGEPAPRVLKEGLGLLQTSDLISACQTLSVPSLWCAGARDRLVSPAAMQTASELANGAFISIAGGGHAPFLTHTTHVVSAIQSFLSKHNASTPCAIL